jgi:hypothetical protein
LILEYFLHLCDNQFLNKETIILNTEEMIKTWGQMMLKNNVFTFFIVLLLLLTFFTLNVPQVVAPQPIEPPEVKNSAPTIIQLEEDAPSYYLDLYKVFDVAFGQITFYIWTGSAWETELETKIITASIQANDTVKFILLENMSGTENISLNATNSGGSAQHNLTLKILSVNDPPVIETIGNIIVKDTKSASIFVYQDDWYNSTVIASDIDGDTIIFLDNSTLFDINYLTGYISFKPNNNDVGIYHINITVSDINGTNNEDLVDIKLTILNVNDPPSCKINIPINGSQLSSWDYYFEAEGFDPDIQFGDQLNYSWYSDIDGRLGNGPDIYVYYLSSGKHEITLNVTDAHGLHTEAMVTIFIDDKYDLWYSEVVLFMEKNYIIVKQDDIGKCKINITNYGVTNENITVEVEKYFEFSGSVNLDIDDFSLKPYESKTLNLTVEVPKNTEIGAYQLSILVETDDNKYGYYDDNFASIKLIVIENSTNAESKQANKPNWEPGNKWEYSVTSTDYSSGFPAINGTFIFTITKDTTVKVNDESYEAFEISLDSELKLDDNPGFGMFEDVDVTMTGKAYLRKSDLATVKHELTSSMIMNIYGEEMSTRSEVSTVYEPPMNDIDFPMTPGKFWTVSSLVTTKTTTTDLLHDMSNPYSYSEVTKENRSYVCLGTKQVTINAGTFEAYLIMEFDRETEFIYDDMWDDYRSGSSRAEVIDFGDNYEENYLINYYSPEVGYIIRADSYERTYDYDIDIRMENSSWQKSTTMELISYSIKNQNIDSDKDGISDIWEDKHHVEIAYNDDDNDTFTNLEEYMNGTDPNDPEDTPDNPIDNDKDGIPDTWERDNNLNPNDPSDAIRDYDNDGFSNYKEYESHTSPRNPDDHPQKRDNDDNNRDSGKVKIGGFEVIYIVIFVIVIILLLFISAIMVRRKIARRSKNIKTQFQQEPRVQSETYEKELKSQNITQQPMNDFQVPQKQIPINPTGSSDRFEQYPSRQYYKDTDYSQYPQYPQYPSYPSYPSPEVKKEPIIQGYLEPNYNDYHNDQKRYRGNNQK